MLGDYYTVCDVVPVLLSLAGLDTRLLSIDVKFYQFCSVRWLVHQESRDGQGRGERGQTQNSVFLVKIWSRLGCITVLARIKHIATSSLALINVRTVIRIHSPGWTDCDESQLVLRSME